MRGARRRGDPTRPSAPAPSRSSVTTDERVVEPVVRRHAARPAVPRAALPVRRGDHLVERRQVDDADDRLAVAPRRRRACRRAARRGRRSACRRADRRSSGTARCLRCSPSSSPRMRVVGERGVPMTSRMSASDSRSASVTGVWSAFQLDARCRCRSTRACGGRRPTRRPDRDVEQVARGPSARLTPPPARAGRAARTAGCRRGGSTRPRPACRCAPAPELRHLAVAGRRASP